MYGSIKTAQLIVFSRILIIHRCAVNQIMLMWLGLQGLASCKEWLPLVPHTVLCNVVLEILMQLCGID